MAEGRNLHWEYKVQEAVVGTGVKPSPPSRSSRESSRKPQPELYEKRDEHKTDPPLAPRLFPYLSPAHFLMKSSCPALTVGMLLGRWPARPSSAMHATNLTFNKGLGLCLGHSFPRVGGEQPQSPTLSAPARELAGPISSHGGHLVHSFSPQQR